MRPLKILGVIILTLIGIVVFYSAVVIFTPFITVSKQPVQKEKQADIPVPTCRKDVSFKVDGLLIRAWLYLPDDLSKPLACVVMGSGFGGTKEETLEEYALRFVEYGLAVLSIDFRYFGFSDGEPRQLFSIEKQLEDYRAAIEYARNREEIDPVKIAVWGTSASGGYGLILAASDKKIACVIGQCPALDRSEDAKLAVEREGMGFYLQIFFVHGLRDIGRSIFGLSPHKLPIVGKPDTMAMLRAPGAFDGYSKLASKSETFVNEVCARSFLDMGKQYNPIDYAENVKCPVLLQICEKDNLISKTSYINTAKILGDYAEVKTYPVGHFDIYLGENFEKAVSDQITFIKNNL
jgi:dienelactone hydrolase